MSLARPGGNITGFAMYEPAMATKWLEPFKEIAPGVTRVALLFNPGTAPGRGAFFSDAIEAGASSFGMASATLPVGGAAETRHRSVCARSEWRFVRHARCDHPISSAVDRRTSRAAPRPCDLLTAIFHHERWPHLLWSRHIRTVSSGSYVDRILRGAKPNELP